MDTPLQRRNFASVLFSVLSLGCSGTAYAQTTDPGFSVDQVFLEIGKTVGGAEAPFSVGNRGTFVEVNFEPRNLRAAKALKEKYGEAVQINVGHLRYPEDTLYRRASTTAGRDKRSAKGTRSPWPRKTQP